MIKRLENESGGVIFALKINGYGYSVERKDHRSTRILKSCQGRSQRAGKNPQATFSARGMFKNADVKKHVWLEKFIRISPPD
jgi:hypothetical protein